MRLKRGHILLIAGGAVAAVSLTMLGYYGMKLITTIEGEEKHKIQPNDMIPVTANISNTEQGAYAVAFSDFTGGRPTVTIRDPSNQTILGKAVEPPFVIELFTVTDGGIYTLTLSNPSSDQVLEASVLLGSQENVLSKVDITTAIMTFAFGLLLIGGIAAAVAGAVITVIDKRRFVKMKQFGDTSDLV
ncbi:MAG: hypothetical protein ACREA4_08405 [Nitrososphaera sp.]